MPRTISNQLGWIRVAARNAQVPVVFLQHGAHAGRRAMDKWTLLHRAVQGGHVGLARVLLDYAADANAQTVDKWTPLHLERRKASMWNPFGFSSSTVPV